MFAEVIEVEQNLVEVEQIQMVAQAHRSVHHAKPLLGRAKMHPRRIRFQQAFEAFDFFARYSHQPVFLVLVINGCHINLLVTLV